MDDIEQMLLTIGVEYNQNLPTVCFSDAYELIQVYRAKQCPNHLQCGLEKLYMAEFSGFLPNKECGNP